MSNFIKSQIQPDFIQNYWQMCVLLIIIWKH